MLKTYKQMKRLEKGQFNIPKSVQDTIPIRKIWLDGVFQLSEKVSGFNQYSVTYRVSDINYSISSPQEKKEKFLAWESVLNAFDPDARYKISVFKRRINVAELKQNVTMSLHNDEYDEYRNIFNKVVMDKALTANGITQEIYLTVTTWKKDIDAARTFFKRQYTQISQAFAVLQVKIEQINANERLKIFRDFYIQGNESDEINIEEAIKQGADIRDYICPDMYSNDRHSADYFRIGSNYGRAIYLRTYASFIKDNIVSNICNINRPCCFSIDLVAIPTDEAVKAAEDIKTRVEGNKEKRLRKQAERGFTSGITYDMQKQIEEADEYLNDLIERDQRMFVATISMVHLASSMEELKEDTNEIFAAARQGMCDMGTLMFQQLQGLITALPYGCNYLSVERTLTSESAGIFLPFRAQEVTDKGGLWRGVNAVTGNLLLFNLSKLNNPNRIDIGVPGSGKSFGVKLNIIQQFLDTDADIIITDPENEYSTLVEALGGQVIKISAQSDTHINPFDMVSGYADAKENAYYSKSNFIVSLFELIDTADMIGGDDKSIIDRCVINIYKKCENTPTLLDLKNELELQPEQRAKALALKLELFTTGSLKEFSYQTNVDYKKRLICFNTSELEGDLKQIGNLIVIDTLINRVTQNAQAGKWTYLYFDEFQTNLKHKYSAEYFNSAWRRYRKRSASPCGITQNIEYLKSDVEFSTMLGNSACITLYQLSPDDIEIVAGMYGLSDKQLKFVSNTSLPGNGLMCVGGSIVPFDGQFPKGNKLYDLMTTKPGEWAFNN